MSVASTPALKLRRPILPVEGLIAAAVVRRNDRRTRYTTVVLMVFAMLATELYSYAGPSTVGEASPRGDGGRVVCPPSHDRHPAVETESRETQPPASPRSRPPLGARHVSNLSTSRLTAVEACFDEERPAEISHPSLVSRHVRLQV